MRPDGRGKISHESAGSTADRVLDLDARCPSCPHPRHSGECSAAVPDGSGGYPCGCTADVDAAKSQEPPLCEKCGERHYHRTKPFEPSAAYVVEWGNEFPAEIDSLWTTEEEAQKRADEMNEKYDGWRVRRWALREKWEAESNG